MIRLPGTEISLPLLFSSKRVFNVADTLPDVEIEEHKIEEPSTKPASKSSTTHLVASDSLPI